MPPRAFAAVCGTILVLVAAPASASGAGAPSVAALQVALQAKGLYSGDIDGVAGPATTAAIRRLQRKERLPVDGVVGPRTRAALGLYGRHTLGSRPLAVRDRGWDVAELQFLLAWHGFPSGPFDGHLGQRTAAALKRFQRWARLVPDGIAGATTIAALRRPVPTSPIALGAPVVGALGDRFGPRGTRFHAGVDLVAPAGTPVVAAAAGRVTFAGRRDGWGVLVTVAHASGVRTMYAHLSRRDVVVGDRVLAGARLGLVGATGHASGPHLHLEVRVRGAAVDPLTALAL